MKRVAVAGVGMTKFSGKQSKTNLELFSEAAIDAINESSIKAKDIQALFIGNCLGDFTEGQAHLQALAADSIGAFNVPAFRFESACATASVALQSAYRLVSAGIYDQVLVGGVETAAKMGTPLATRAFAMFSDSHYEFPAGLTFPGVFALLTHLYSKKYGIPLEKLKEQMYQVSINSHYYGARNPRAQLQKELNIEDARKGAMIASPLQLHDCCPFSDGAAALVLVSEEKAKRMTKKPVYVAGVGQASAGGLATQKAYLPMLRARELAAKEAFKMAGVSQKDINVCEIHDCFSIATLLSLEGLGFFPEGTSGEAVLKGETGINGKIPTNISGGLKAKGHPIGATGVAQVFEIVNQLRGECGVRQVDGARIGLADTLGGGGGTVCVTILKRGW